MTREMAHDARSRLRANIRLAAVIFATAILIAVLPRASRAGQASTQQASTSPQSPKQADSAPATSQSQPPKPHKVITNDDIAADHARALGKGAGGGKAGPQVPESSACDAGCAAEARDMSGYGPEHEGEWQFLLAAARRNLAADKQWAAAQRELANAVQNLCTFEYQQQVAVPPSGSDWQSLVDRAQRQKEVENMTRMLNQNLSNANARMGRLIQQADEAEPVRGAIMQVLASRINDSCADDD